MEKGVAAVFRPYVGVGVLNGVVAQVAGVKVVDSPKLREEQVLRDVEHVLVVDVGDDAVVIEVEFFFLGAKSSLREKA